MKESFALAPPLPRLSKDFIGSALAVQVTPKHRICHESRLVFAHLRDKELRDWKVCNGSQKFRIRALSKREKLILLDFDLGRRVLREGSETAPLYDHGIKVAAHSRRVFERRLIWRLPFCFVLFAISRSYSLCRLL